MWNKYTVAVTLVEPLLGVTPKNPEVYKAWIAAKQAEAKGDEGTPEYTEDRSWTGFCCDDKGLYLMDYHLKGYFKEVAAVMPEILGMKRKSGEFMAQQTIKSRLDNWLFVGPRKIYLGRKQPDGYIERPLRAQTLQGARIALARSDYVNAGTVINFTLTILASCLIKQDHLEAWLAYGEMKGLGQFRTGGYGRFNQVSLSPIA